MKISKLYQHGKTIFSFEIFPPKPEMPVETIYNTINEIKDLNPAFISVTYGAGGSNRSRTIEISSKIKNQMGIEVLSHLTCVASSSKEIDSILASLKKENIENILALRGDPPKDICDFDFSRQEFCYASDLISYISKKGAFCIGSACYPEGHLESKNLQSDIANLKIKYESGVDFMNTQLFFDNSCFYSFMDKIRKSGINCPVSAGIMPIYNTSLIKKMTIMCGASIPKKLVSMLNKYDNNPEDLTKAGIEYAVVQITDLIKNGVQGIHLYTMNKSNLVREIVEKVPAF